MKRAKKTSGPVISHIEYESLFDEAMDMARDLQDIEHEVKLCAYCDGREDCGYSAKALLEKLSYILFKSIGYHKSEKYARHIRPAKGDEKR